MSRYIVKVNPNTTTYLWGGDSINTQLLSSLFFTFRVVDMGESINFGIRTNDPVSRTPTLTDMGTLKENETFTIKLNNIYGIYARCVDSNVDTKVECFIESSLSSSD